MKFKKLFPLIIIVILSSVPLVSAAETLYRYNDTLNFYSWSYFPVQTVANSVTGGFNFEGNNEYLSRVSFYFKNDSAAESGTVRAVLYENMTLYLSSYKPIDSAPIVATSDTWTISPATLNGTRLYTFTFNSTKLLEAGTRYGIGIQTVAGGASTIPVGYSYSGGMFYDTGGDDTYTTHSMSPICYLYTDDTLGGSGATSAPTATPYGGTTDSVSELINQFIDFLIPIIVMLIPAVLLGYVFRMGKWGYIIGLAIGTGLGVMFIAGFPLWLAFAVFIGLIGFAYSEVRRGI